MRENESQDRKYCNKSSHYKFPPHLWLITRRIETHVTNKSFPHHCSRWGSGDGAVHQRRRRLESAATVGEQQRIASIQQSSPRLPSAAAARFRRQEEPTAGAGDLLQGQCQGRRQVPGLAEQGEHAGKCREPARGRASESADRDRGVDDGLEPEQAQRKGPHRPAHSVLREPLRSQGEAQQHGEDPGALLERAERKVSRDWIASPWPRFPQTCGSLRIHA